MRPIREHATNNGQTYMVASSPWGRRALSQKERWARLLIDTLYHYRGSALVLNEFVIMPDHIHVLLTPATSLEKAVQFIKGGFSYRAKKESGSNLEVWQTGFSDHRIRDASDEGLKPVLATESHGAPEGAPFQNNISSRTLEPESVHIKTANGRVEIAPSEHKNKTA